MKKLLVLFMSTSLLLSTAYATNLELRLNSEVSNNYTSPFNGTVYGEAQGRLKGGNGGATGRPGK